MHEYYQSTFKISQVQHKILQNIKFGRGHIQITKELHIISCNFTTAINNLIGLPSDVISPSSVLSEITGSSSLSSSKEERSLVWTELTVMSLSTSVSESSDVCSCQGEKERSCNTAHCIWEAFLTKKKSYFNTENKVLRIRNSKRKKKRFQHLKLLSGNSEILLE